MVDPPRHGTGLSGAGVALPRFDARVGQGARRGDAGRRLLLGQRGRLQSGVVAQHDLGQGDQIGLGQLGRVTGQGTVPHGKLGLRLNKGGRQRRRQDPSCGTDPHRSAPLRVDRTASPP